MPSPRQSSPDASRKPFGAAPDPLIALRRDMMVWAEPVIADCIIDGYRERAVDGALRSLVSTHHRRLWRAMILEHRPLMESIRHDLKDDLLRAGVEPEVIEEIDQSVMEELMDIVFKRFRSSRDMAKGFSLVLLSAASHMGASRAMAS